jgi:hypothetical protein
MLSAALPVLVSVTDLLELPPTATCPKDQFEGDTLSNGFDPGGGGGGLDVVEASPVVPQPVRKAPRNAIVSVRSMNTNFCLNIYEFFLVKPA